MGPRRQQIDRFPRPGVARQRIALLAALIACGAAVACSSEVAMTTTGPAPTKCQVTLASATTLGPEGGTGAVIVTTAPECPWTVSTAASWLSGVSPGTGQGNGTVEFLAAPNPLPLPRDADIVVNDNRLRLSQPAAACRYELRPSALTVDAGGGRREVQVSAMGGCGWTMTTDASWLSFTTAPSGSGDGAVGLVISPNAEATPRTATVALGDRQLVVTQLGGTAVSCRYTVGLAPSVAVAATGGSWTVDVTTNPDCAWTTTSDVPWITIASPVTRAGPGPVSLVVASNPGAARSGVLTLADRTVTVTQAAASATCSYIIAPRDATIVASGGSGAVAVSATAGCAWTASSSAPWLTISGGVSGSGNGAVSYSVAANSGSARVGTVTIAGQPFTVAQAAAAVSCSFTISPTNAALAATAGSGSVSVSSAAGCAWTASSAASWITVTGGANGSGNGSVSYSVATNAGSARTGTVTIAGQAFSVAQAAGAVPCAYTLSPSGAAIAAAGGSGTAAVSSGNGCAWAAVSSATWLTITAGASGSGNGTLAYSATPNTGSARSATITVAGQTLTVTQGAVVACTFTVDPTSFDVDKKAGSVTVGVSAGAGCAWTARSNSTWISVTSGASGSGNGSVKLDVEKNSDKKGRTGTVTIAGRTVTVKQDGD